MKTLTGTEPLNQDRPRPVLRASDWVVIAYLLVESALIVLFARRPESEWLFNLGINAVMAAGIFLLTWGAERSRLRVVRIVRDWYPALYVLVIFKQLGVLVPAVHPATTTTFSSPGIGRSSAGTRVRFSTRSLRRS